MNEISMRLLDTIKERQMSYSELAEKTGIAKSAIQRYATGETKKIPLPRLELLVEVGDLLVLLDQDRRRGLCDRRADGVPGRPRDGRRWSGQPAHHNPVPWDRRSPSPAG